MKKINLIIKYTELLPLLILFLIFFSCKQQHAKKSLVFTEYPNIRLGFSSQNFLKALPLNVAGLTEVIEYASTEGYQFVEIRDQFVDLTIEDCNALSGIAKENNMDIIYVFNKNPLDSGYFKIFEKALANVQVFKGPGILRALASKTEFEADPSKKGWTKDELVRLAGIADSCSVICKSKNIRFVFENSNEAFFGDGSTFFGLADLFSNTTGPGIQFDIANPFRKTARSQNDPAAILEYLPTLGDRWVETHLKTIRDGEPQTVLTEDNPIPVEKIIELMGNQNVTYAALELTAVEDKQQCFDNHAKSIQFLKEKGILKK
jgi:sugar phosphate isomerase/epimerase